MQRADLEQEFAARLFERWRRGAVERGDASFDRPLATTADEMLQEVEDIAGWAFVLWVQLRMRLQRVVLAANRLEGAD